MKKMIAFCLLASFNLFGEEKVTVILEDNLLQTVGGRNANVPVYEGDPALKNAFSALQVRLQTMLVSSGRVDVKPKSSVDKTLTEDDVYLCNYTLVQGRRTGVTRGKKEEYIIGINLQGWNFKNETPIPELTRTVDLKLFEDSPENAFKYVTRYLAFITLEAVAPVVIEEIDKDENAVSVNVGGEIVQPGDILKVRKGLRSTIEIRVENTELRESVCIVVNPADVDAIKPGAKCAFQLPENLSSDTAQAKNKQGYVPTVVIREIKQPGCQFEYTALQLKAQLDETGSAISKVGSLAGAFGRKKTAATANIIGGMGAKNYSVEPAGVQQRTDFSSAKAPAVLLAKIKSQNMGLRVLSFDGMTDAQIAQQGRSSDYELVCEIIGYKEEHLDGKYVDEKLTFTQRGVLTANVTLRNCESMEAVSGKSIPVTAVCTRTVTTQAENTAGSLLAWDDVMTEAAAQLAVEVRKAVATITK